MCALLEVSKFEDTTRDDLDLTRKTSWYPTEHKHEGDELLRRVMYWNDAMGDGEIEFYTHDKTIYDRIYEYFNLRRKPPTSFSSELEFLQLDENENETKWKFEEGTVKCYHEWCAHTEENSSIDGWGEIEFKTNDKDLFIKFASYVVKFIP